MTRQHGLINRCNLVGKWINEGGMDGKHRVKKMGKTDAMRFRYQAEHGSIAVETPGTSLFHQIKSGLVVTIEQFVRHLTGGSLVGKFKGLAVPGRDKLSQKWSSRSEPLQG